MWTDGSQFLPTDCLTLVGASPAGREVCHYLCQRERDETGMGDALTLLRQRRERLF